MENPFKWKIIEHNGKKMHEGVHALIKSERKFLLIDRRFYPLGYSMVSGHVNKGEDPEQALVREVKEELRLNLVNSQFLITSDQNDICPMIFYKHLNHIFSGEIEGLPRLNFEAKNFGWFAPETLVKLKLTDFTRKVLKQLMII